MSSVPPFAVAGKLLQSGILRKARRFKWEPTAMPKQKTHKGTKKRFRLTAKGKVKHRQAGTSHLAFRLSTKRKRNLRGTATLAKPMEKAIQKALNGYSN
jgi:large subunit ribosomal protein L35